MFGGGDGNTYLSSVFFRAHAITILVELNAARPGDLTIHCAP